MPSAVISGLFDASDSVSSRNGVVEFGELHDAVHEAPALSLDGGDAPPRQHELERELSRQVALDDGGDHEGPQPEVDLGRAHLGVGSRDDEIARQHQSETTRQSMSVDARHDRQTRLAHLLEELADLGSHEVLCHRSFGAHCSQIAARTEGLVPGPRENRDHHRIVSLGASEGLGERACHLGIDRVSQFGPVDRDGGHRTVGPELNDLVRHFVATSS